MAFKSAHACDACRKRKGRCELADSSVKVCNHCISFGIPCTYQHPGFGTGKRMKRIRPEFNDHNRSHVDHRSVDLNHNAVANAGPSPATGGMDLRTGANQSESVPGFLRNPALFKSTWTKPPLDSVVPEAIQAGPRAPSDTADSLASPIELHNIFPGISSHVESSLGDATDLSMGQQSSFEGDSPEGLSEYLDADVNMGYIQDLYKRYLEAVVPFLGESAFESQNVIISTSVLLATATCSGCSGFMIRLLKGLLKRIMRNSSAQDYSEDELRALLLVPLKVEQDTDSAHLFYEYCKYIAMMKDGIFSDEPVPMKTCAMTASTWLSFRSNDSPPILFGSDSCSFSSVQKLSEALTSLSQICNRILFRLTDPKEILELEYEMLQWAARMPPSLIYINLEYSDMNAALLHVLHNAVMIMFYSYYSGYPGVLLHADNPGLLNFIAVLANSTLESSHHPRYRPIRYAWSTLYDAAINFCLAELRRLVLQHHFDKFLITLVRFHQRYKLPSNEEMGFIDRCARELYPDEDAEDQRSLILKHSETTDVFTEKEGAYIYWVYRDVRSMSIHSLLRNNK